MKRYPKYRDSGLPWLGEIPTHWQTVRNKNLLKEVETRSEYGTELLLSLSRERGLIPQSEQFDRGQTAASLIGYRVCDVGQIVMNRLQAWNGMFAVATVKGLVSPDYAVLTPKTDVNVRYLLFLFKTPRMVNVFHQRSRGIGSGFFRLYLPDFGDIHSALPPRKEQDAIVAFLDRKLADIDRYIQNKQHQIDLLREFKISLINKVVTRGIQKRAQLKHSGVDWLAEIPSHWQRQAIKRHFHVELGKMLNSSQQSNTEIKKPYLRAANITKHGIDVSDVNEMGFEPGQLYRYRLHSGDVLVTEGGVTVGRSAIWHDELPEVYYQNSINRLRPYGEVSAEFFCYWMNSQKDAGILDALLDKATFSHLTNEKLKALPIAVPPKTEQTEITNFIEVKANLVETEVATIEEHITLIKNFRTALISNAVTGKIDVR